MEHDDGIRPDISTAALSKLKAVFKKDGSTTAGNSSQVGSSHLQGSDHFCADMMLYAMPCNSFGCGMRDMFLIPFSDRDVTLA